MKTAIVILALLSAGCASTITLPAKTPGVLCLPSGVPQAIVSWPVMQVDTVGPVSMVAYELDGHRVILGWYKGTPAVIDIKPSDPDSPMAFNEQVFPSGGTLRDATGPCSWHLKGDRNDKGEKA